MICQFCNSIIKKGEAKNGVCPFCNTVNSLITKRVNVGNFEKGDFNSKISGLDQYIRMENYYKNRGEFEILKSQ